MSNSLVFSWAEKDGRLIHVDDASLENGLKCGCCCPYCHEKVLARRGNVYEHGFAHHSETRGANLRICYMVTLYKLAEQIIQTKKYIMAPSYYGIFPPKILNFVHVDIDNQFDRDDKQPDVIATTADGKKYLIEFVFDYKVQRKTDLDYKNLSCIEVDLKGQTLESLEEFLLTSEVGKKWLNNEYYFEKIEDRYRTFNKRVRVVDTTIECDNCLIHDNCCAAKPKNHYQKLIIYHNGRTFALCKIEEYERTKKIIERQQLQAKEYNRIINKSVTTEETSRARENSKSYKENQTRHIYEIKDTQQEQERLLQERFNKYKIKHQKEIDALATLPPNCLNCEKNLPWGSRNGLGNCGPWISLRTPQYPNPEYAKGCKHFKVKKW